NNAWGKDASGGSCLNVTSNATTIAATWTWTNTSSADSVHAFPNLLLNSIQQSPVHLSNLTSLVAHVDWHMGPSTMPTSSTFETTALEKLNATANVAFDMFLDPDPRNATSTVSPTFEVMVWLATIGPTYPIGYFNATSSARPRCKMGGTDFELYTGTNTLNQHVFSWVPTKNTTSFTGDLAVGIHYLSENNLLPGDNYLGVVQFGTETFFAEEYVTFTAAGISVDVVRNDS
ncbi:concanavalin A-like lectin/glucanase domain-containing protein, partial [Leptodontidium sp. MPI-SDFR-AT-0119]